MRPRWAKAAALLLLLFAFGVLTATVMFVTGGFDRQASLPNPEPRSDEVVVTVKPVRLNAATRQVDLLVSLDPSANGSPVGLTLTGPDGVSIEVSLPPSSTVSVGAETNPQAFPDDSYVLRAMVTSTGAPVSVSVQANPGLVDWHMSTLDDCGGCVGLVFERPLHVRLFVYGVALAPLLLGLSAGLHWLNDRASRSAPIELGAALLALLPLRDVLVPDDIPGITRLDHLLGGEVVLIAAAVAVVTAVALWRRSAVPSAPADGPAPLAPPVPPAGFVPPVSSGPQSSPAGFVPPVSSGPQSSPALPAPRVASADTADGPGDRPGDGLSDRPGGSGLLRGEGEADVPDRGVGEGRDEGADRPRGDGGQAAGDTGGRQS